MGESKYLDIFCKFSEIVYFVSFIATGNIGSAVLTVYFSHQFILAGAADIILATLINTLHVAYTIYATLVLWSGGDNRDGTAIIILVVYISVFIALRIVYFVRLFKSYINIG